MPARLTAYLPDNAAAPCLLRLQQRVRIGRGTDCDFRLDHPSISRRHAELSLERGSWRLADVGSKNGCFLDGVRTTSAVLDGPTWLRFGDIHCEFAPLSEEAADNAEKRISVKRSNSLVLAERLAQQTSLPDLLTETLRATVELAECERGFLLLAEQSRLQVVASQDVDLLALRSREFKGSVGAMQRALGSKLAVVVNDVLHDPELAQRASVVAGGLRALICLPLLAGSDIVGVIYADSRKAGTVITTMDLELLAVFAERASLWIAARRGVAALSELLPKQAPAWADILDVQQWLQESA
jgi:hypothetical protein